MMRRCSNPAAALILVVCAGTGADRALVAGTEIPFEVRETSGIRRRYDVVTVRLPSETIVRADAPLRLLRMGEPVPGQFRSVRTPEGATELVVDFVDHFAPFESRRYVLEVLDAAADEPVLEEPAGGLELTESAEAYTIESGGVVRWTVPKDLRGLLQFTWNDVDYVADRSPGLYVLLSDGTRQLLADRPPASATIERSGPLACSLRFDFRDWPGGADSRLSMEFVRTKSWVRAAWTIEGEPSGVEQIGVALNLALDGPETLLDFGGGDYVYATATQDQAARLEAGPRADGHVPWQFLQGPREQLQPVVVASREVPTPAVHGWAHVMDSRRCTALAVGDFGEASADAITFDGRGELHWTRQLARQADARPTELEFWLHFVTMPVQIGARTSPRSMQEPLEVRRLME